MLLLFTCTTASALTNVTNHRRLSNGENAVEKEEHLIRQHKPNDAQRFHSSFVVEILVGSAVCTGTLVSNTIVLTALHCLVQNDDAPGEDGRFAEGKVLRIRAGVEEKYTNSFGIQKWNLTLPSAADFYQDIYCGGDGQ